MYEHASVPRSGIVAQGMLTGHGKGPKSVLVCFHVFFFKFCVFVNWDLLPNCSEVPDTCFLWYFVQIFFFLCARHE